MNLEDFLYPLLSRYTASPPWVKRTFGAVYAAMPRALRFGQDYDLWSALARERDLQALQAIARDALRATLREALDHVPAYAEHRTLARELDDPYAVLRCLPTCRKADIKVDVSRFASTRLGPRERLQTFTGGSTSEPMRFYLHAGITRTKEYAFMDDFHARFGMTPTDISLAMRGRSVPSAASGGALWMYEPIKRWLIVSSDHLEPRFMPQYVDAMRQWKPTIVSANPSGAYPLAKWLKAHPAPDVTERIKGVALFGENLYDHQLATLREVFHCPVLNHYGHSERVLMAAAIPGDDRLYFWPQYGHVELVDEQGSTITEPGIVGEIVGTSFHNAVMPFVRYRTGDLGAWSGAPSKGPTGFPVLEQFEGRLQEFVVCSDRRLVTVATLGAAHFSALAEVGAIQYEQREPGRIILRVETRAPLSADARRGVEQAVFEKTQGGCRVNVEEVASLPRTSRGKRSLLIQKLDLSGYLGASHSGGA